MLIKWTPFAAFAAMTSFAAPALAAPVDAPSAPEGRALLLRPLTLVKVSDASFGTVIANTSTSVTVTIDPSTGNRTSSHPASLFASDPGGRAYFAGAGTPGQQVVMSLTYPATLGDGLGNSITLVTMLLDGPATRTIAADQTFYVGVGGVIQVPADAPEGTYRANFDLTADYQ